MRRQIDVIVPAGTPIDLPYRERVVLNVGTLVRVGLRFRSGAHHRVYVTVRDGLYTICPAEGSDPLYGDREVIEMGMDYPLVGPAAALVLTAWSPGTLYDHRVTAWFDIQEDEGQVVRDFLDNLQYAGE